MNVPYFVCETCKTRIEAGYRWATSHLGHDAEIVKFGQLVNIQAALEYKPFWNLPNSDDHNWLRELLPKVRAFLECHKDHGIRFGDDVSFSESYFGFDWLDISPSPDLVPRHFAEQMRLQSWEQVCNYIDSIDEKPWWWHTEDHRDAKRAFEQIVTERRITK